MKLVQSARELATQYHEKQRRSGTDTPYIEHPARVAHGVEQHFKESASPEDLERLVAIAWLHDILEDTPCTANELVVTFGIAITLGVQQLTSCSKQMKVTLPRETRKKLDRAYLAEVPVDIRVIKAIDRLDNLSDTGKTDDPNWGLMYANESELLLSALRLPSWETPLVRSISTRIHELRQRGQNALPPEKPLGDQ